MSLTSEFEISDMFEKPKVVYHRPRWINDTEKCNRKTGHCTNTDSCIDRCDFYRSMMQVKEHNDYFKGR